jgi:hypothetical protein
VSGICRLIFVTFFDAYQVQIEVVLQSGSIEHLIQKQKVVKKSSKNLQKHNSIVGQQWGDAKSKISKQNGTSYDENSSTNSQLDDLRAVRRNPRVA